MVFIRTHHPKDFIAVEVGIVGGDAPPEPGDLQNHFRPVKGQELEIIGHLEIVIDIVGNGRIDVVLQVGVVGNPVARLRIEVDLLAFLPAAAATLPGIKGAAVTGGLGVAPGRIQTPVPVL